MAGAMTMNINDDDGGVTDIRAARDELLADPESQIAYDRRKYIISMAKMLRSWRRQAGLTQDALKVESGLLQSTISRIESPNNRSMPSLETIIAFAHGCGHPLTLGRPSELIERAATASIEDDFEVKKAAAEEDDLAISL